MPKPEELLQWDSVLTNAILIKIRAGSGREEGVGRGGLEGGVFFRRAHKMLVP